MSWTSIDAMSKQIERRWERGDVLRSLVHDTGIFPLRLRVSTPSSNEMVAEYVKVQKWLEALDSLRHIRIERATVRGRSTSQRQMPATLWVDAPNDAIAFLQKEREAERFLLLHDETKRTLPELSRWVEENPLRALALEPQWEHLLQVVNWKKTHPNADPLYMRQVDLPGIDTKFIESNSSVLATLFDIVVSPHHDPSTTMDFRTRYGFLREPARIRFRILDLGIQFAGLPGYPDVELDEDSFVALGSLNLPILRVFVTENKTNFLAFPLVESSIVVFGTGYGMRALGRARWLLNIPVYYWGDIDTHGFAILSEIREFFPHTKSFLMDEATLLKHQNSWTTEPTATRRQMKHLDSSETDVYRKLHEPGPWCGVRLEQEKIPLNVVDSAIQMLFRDEQPA